MKRILFLLSLYVLCSLTTRAQTVTVLNKNEQYNSPRDGMVVMDKYSFGKFHYTASQYDTLKKQIASLDSALERRDSLQTELIGDFTQIVKSKDAEVQTLQQGYNSMRNNLNTCIDKQNQLQADYLQLQQQHQKVKKWRNIFFGTSTALAGIIVLMVVH